MSLSAVILIAIIVVAIASFIFLATVMLRNWNLSRYTKGWPRFTGKSDDDFPRQEFNEECFDACMRKFDWDLTRRSFCAAECKTDWFK